MADAYLGIDYGDARVGVAVATSDARVALPLVVLANDASLYVRLKQLVREHAVTELVVGVPLSMSGQQSERTLITRTFIEKLKSEIQLPIHEEDERLSTVLAKRLGGGGTDAQAAAVILESFLERIP